MKYPQNPKCRHKDAAAGVSLNLQKQISCPWSYLTPPKMARFLAFWLFFYLLVCSLCLSLTQIILFRLVQSRSPLPMVTYICVSGGRLGELRSHVCRVQPFHHKDERSPQLRKATLWIRLRKQSKSIALAVVGSTYVKYIRAVPRIFLQVGFESHFQLASAFCTSLGWDSSS